MVDEGGDRDRGDNGGGHSSCAMVMGGIGWNGVEWVFVTDKFVKL